MLSFLLPTNIKISIASGSGFIKIEGPKGVFLKKTGALKFHQLTTSQGIRIFIKGASAFEEATALSHLMSLIVGLSRGFRQRLRLVGIGFRATLREGNLDRFKGSSVNRQSFLQKRLIQSSVSAETTSDKFNKKIKALFLKIGYSHESVYPVLNIQSNTQSIPDVSVSRIEGRTKGSLICISGQDHVSVKQRAAEISAYRLPDIYKGKGIHYDRQILTLKKGKRQG